MKIKKVLFAICVVIVFAISYIYLKNNGNKKEDTNIESNSNLESNSNITSNQEKIKYDVDIDKIVKQYKLDKNIVYDDEYLFSKYAYTIENNKGLSKHKLYMYKLYYTLYDNKEFLDEEMFFDALSKLKIQENTQIVTSGLYTNNKLLIDVLSETNELTIMHELMHFLDYRLNDNYTQKLDENKYNKLTEEEKMSYPGFIDASVPEFMIEGGAEKYSTYYFFHSNEKSYDNSIGLYYALEYIIGADNIKKIYFGHENLYNYLFDYLTSSEYSDFFISSVVLNGLNEKNNPDDYATTLDTICNIYYKKYNKVWYSDEKFAILIYRIVRDDVSLYKKSKNYKNLLSIYKKYKKIEDNVYWQIKADYNEAPDPIISIQYENNNIYFITSLNKNNKVYIVKYTYDFKTNKIKKVAIYKDDFYNKNN